jgi:outer membrane immunogenic protein
MKVVIGALAALGFVGTGALAADLPAKAPIYKAPASAPVVNWTGLYVGGHVGGVWTDAEWADPPGVFRSVFEDGSGFLGGAQLGYNWQAGNWVFGLQGDVSWTSIDPKTNGVDFPAAVYNYRTDMLATVTGRIGYAWNNVLVYGKGGVAFAHNKFDVVNGTVHLTADETQSGWTAGGGAEFRFAPNWSVFAEYNYVDLGTKRIPLTDPVIGPNPADFSQDLHNVKLGLNFKFGG